MIPRDAATKIRHFATQYPVITLTGPRQSGKTTLCRMLFPDKPYVSLEAIAERDFAVTDPQGFLARYPNGAVLDEIQRVPDLLSYLQVIVDETTRPGQFIVTGSQNFALLQSVSQSLAGRTALVTLLPFSLAEILHTGFAGSLDDLLFTGCYPRIYDMGLNPTEALSFYVSTYVERDLRTLLNVKDLSRFETFLRLCAGRSGQVVNLSSLGNDCGVNHNTVKSWLSILETSYIVKLLRPYHNNLGKRLIKAPKLYFLDVGLAAFLLGIQDASQIATHPLRGPLFETLIFAELLKKRLNSGKTDNLAFLRDSTGREVDVVLDYGNQLDLWEIKAGQTISRDMLKNLKHYQTIYPQVRHSNLLYGGDQERTQEKVHIVGWRHLAGLQID
jgi:predicted AAA+ superfamily ATPase